MQLAFLFPGQGAQSEGYLRRLPEHARVRETLQEASDLLGEAVESYDRGPALQSTVGVQLGLLVAGVAQARALEAEGVLPDAAAGLSVGAFGAAVACGALEFADALRLVRLRARCMEDDFPRGYGMLAVSGLRQSPLEALLEQVNAGREDPRERAYLANLNGDAQFVVAGAEPQLEELLGAARAAGARQVERLAVAVPSHCPLLAHCAGELADSLRGLRLRDARLPYVANTTARALRAAGDIARDLAEGVMRPVRWNDANRLLLELGVQCVIEMPPGQTLGRMVRQLSCRVEVLVSEESSLRSLVVRAQRARSRQ
ncbi:ACP S-malonyltransferase [Thiomonas sp. FB-6]|uniref:ACP S-malonyltransferase n=1 Tax=Thiomonas sp. FB-6 TaxID=1158291 RepID=UPI000361A37C|nr:acyltransferase domain-containing protein [Thiomonas sp. FB-6]